MFAVDHAATALVIKRRFPSVSLTLMLVSVQAMELAWVGFNYVHLRANRRLAGARRRLCAASQRGPHREVVR
jgi:hypothetical protein